jgi:signal peptidase I
MFSKKKPKVKSEPVSSFRQTREIVESLAVALVLAFFFKAFAAEAFVIPTGSMATTLMGRHKDVSCERCGFDFQISASEESNDGSDRPREVLPQVAAGTCPQCRYTMFVGKDNPDKKTFLSYSGDRIFVNKSKFDFQNPQRWHVTVFRYPGRPQINYIKRLVGLENETLLIGNGDIFVKKDGEEEFKIQRKPLNALKAMLRPVDDNDCVQPALVQLGYPQRWNSTDWTQSEDYKSFQSKENGQCVLTYRNIVPSSDDWSYLSAGQLPPQSEGKKAQLITDFVGYNAGVMSYAGQYNSGQITMRDVNGRMEPFVAQSLHGLGLNWVGDLAFSGKLTIQKTQGTVNFVLVKGGLLFTCAVDLATGQATLTADGKDLATALTPLNQAKPFEVMFVNCDEELRFVVDGKEINFDEKGRYDGQVQRDRSPTVEDLTPARIFTQDAAVVLEHLKLQRDLYYIACDDNSSDTQCDLHLSPFHNEIFSENSLANILSTPEKWKNFGKTNVVKFEIKKDQFLMLGDNSARSKDSRLWTQDGIPFYVPRHLLIGEAVFVYWPHGWQIPGTNIALIPNTKKMRLID